MIKFKAYILKASVAGVHNPPIVGIFRQILGWERGIYYVCTEKSLD